jgi:GNAT superfamily N-acetyltransferase
MLCNCISRWVAPAARRKNVGKALVEEVQKWARSEGLYSKLLLIVADYNVAAIRLYEACGFAPSGTPFDFGDRLPEEEYCYQLL